MLLELWARAVGDEDLILEDHYCLAGYAEEGLFREVYDYSLGYCNGVCICIARESSVLVLHDD